MITAGELRKVVETSQRQVDETLAKIEPKLVEAAEAGEREYACYREVPWDAKSSYCAPEPTRLQQKLVDALKSFGYSAKVEMHGDAYVPRGLADDDGNGPMHQNHVLVVRW